MIKRNLFTITLIFLAIVLVGCSDGVVVDSQYYYDYGYSKAETDDQFDFEGNYIPPELTIDGLKDDSQWDNGSSILTYGKDLNVEVQFYRGDNALFVYFEVADENILTLSEDGGDDVNKGDSVEIYLNIANDDSSKPVSDDIQINIGANGKTRILVADDGSWGTWTGLIDFAIETTGTLNDDSDVDTGYAIELMVPYSQINMSKDDVIGVSFGHVDKVNTGNAANTDYSWNGIVFGGMFIDPQSPVTYIIFKDQSFYTRSDMPLENINLSGYITNQNGQVVENATVSIGTQTTTTDSLGYYLLENVSRDDSFTVNVSKTNFTSYEKIYTKQEARTLADEVELDITLIDLTSDVDTTLTATVENVYEGVVEGVQVEIITNDQTYQTSTDAQGLFNIEIEVTESMTINISKEGYQSATYAIDSSAINASEVTELGILDLMLDASDVFTFGGNRGINGFDATVSRGLDGFHFTFNTETTFVDTAHIELFVDTQTSIADRDDTDYRIDFSSTGSVGITNFGNGTNTDVETSGIVLDIIKEETSAEVSAFIPYAFFGIDPLDVIGISAGVWSGSDWDGWAYLGTFVAPEQTISYVRIGEENQLYAYANNEKTTLFYGHVTSDEQPLEDVNVNGILTNSEGYYEVRTLSEDVTITATKGSYVTFTQAYLEVAMRQSILLDIELVGDFYTNVSGNVGLEGVLIYLEDDIENAVTSDVNGDYLINDILNTSDQTLVFEKDGYNTFELILTAAELQASNPVISNIVLTEETVLGTYQGQVKDYQGNIDNVSVELGSYSTTTDANGSFVLTDIDLMNYTLILSKDGYDTLEQTVTQNDLIANENNEFELLQEGGTSGTFSGKSSEFTTGEFIVQRGIDGLYFTFIGGTEWRTSASQNEIIELFLDTKNSDTTRNDSDYLIGIKADGTISSINNWGGTNTDSQTLVVNKVDENTISLYIPYVFLNMTSDEIFGVSIGVWNEFVSDWDGWAYEETFVAPENPSNYIRVDSNNTFYRYSSNSLTTVFSGYVRTNGTPVENANVNGVLTNEEGYYELRATREDIILTATKTGYIEDEQSFLSINLNDKETQDFNIEPITAVAVLGQVNVEGTSVYVLGDEENAVTADANGDYNLGFIDSTSEVTFVFEKDGYQTKQITVTSQELSEQTSYVLDAILIANDADGIVTGTVVNVNGLVQGATVTMNDLETTTDASGVFTFTQVNAANQTVTVSLTGFEDTVYTYNEEQVSLGQTQQIEILQAGGTSGNFSGKSSEFTVGSAVIHRGYEGIYFTFTGATAWRTSATQNEVIELFLDTGTSSASRDTTDYVVRIKADGSIESIGNWGGSNFDSSTFVVTKLDDQTIKVYIPYAFLSITSTEVIGMSLGVWNEFVSDWDGWAYNDSFIAPEVPTNYVRIGANNQLYRYDSNQTPII